MKCSKCGKEYPSRHYFKGGSICEACFGKLSDEEKRSTEEADLRSAKHEAAQHQVQGQPLRCPICGSDKFWTRRTLMNTPGMTFMGVEWANKQADNYVCKHCGHILWFFKEE
jgi:DNA-directed RNA polymerase subunit RPC12/RpoP